MFCVGDLVCYPMHGVGVIEAIQEQQVLGETAHYYVLRFMTGRMTAMVPVKNAEAVGLRELSDAARCERVIAYLRRDETETLLIAVNLSEKPAKVSFPGLHAEECLLYTHASRAFAEKLTLLPFEGLVYLVR